MNPDRTAEIWNSMFPCPRHRGARVTPLTCWTRQNQTAPANGGKPGDLYLDPECQGCSQGATIRAKVESGEIVLPGKRKTPKWTSRPAATPIIHQPMVKGQIHRPMREEAVKEIAIEPKRRPGRPPKRKESEVAAQAAAQTAHNIVPAPPLASSAPWAKEKPVTVAKVSPKTSPTARCIDPLCLRAGEEIPVKEMAENFKTHKPTRYCRDCFERRRNTKVQAAIDRRPVQSKVEDLFSDYPDLWAKLIRMGKKHKRPPEWQLVAIVEEVVE